MSHRELSLLSFSNEKNRISANSLLSATRDKVSSLNGKSTINLPDVLLEPVAKKWFSQSSTSFILFSLTELFPRGQNLSNDVRT